MMNSINNLLSSFRGGRPNDPPAQASRQGDNSDVETDQEDAIHAMATLCTRLNWYGVRSKEFTGRAYEQFTNKYSEQANVRVEGIACHTLIIFGK